MDLRDLDPDAWDHMGLAITRLVSAGVNKARAEERERIEDQVNNWISEHALTLQPVQTNELRAIVQRKPEGE